MAINNIPGIGPTNADIATAVAAPSAATIAAAVAAPSAASIVTAGNAAGWNIAGGGPLTWTLLGSPTVASQSGVTVTGLSGYKAIKLLFTVIPNASATMQLRFNSDSGSNYSWFNLLDQNGTSGQTAQYDGQRTEVKLSAGQANTSDWFVGSAEIQGSNSNGYKEIVATTVYSDTSYGTSRYNVKSIYKSTSAISSVTIYALGQPFSSNTAQYVHVLGAS